jgi:hypothetical protein
MSDQPGKAVTGAYPTEEPSTIERVKAGLSQGRAIPDVVQPCRSHQGTVIIPKQVGDMLRAAANTLDMPPPARQPRQVALSKRHRVNGRHHTYERTCCRIEPY